MPHHHHNPIQHPEVQIASAGSYIFAFVIALGLMLVSLKMVTDHSINPVALTTSISILALVAGVVQLYLLFKLDLSESQIWHTISLVLTIPLFILSVGLTIWMFHTLAVRTMLPGMSM